MHMFIFIYIDIYKTQDGEMRARHIYLLGSDRYWVIGARADFYT